ncbi:cupin domain-containing protein [Paenibacillus sp. HWE-109]|uniref:cupin domain-containing protein n=1 Tax=Paenibacillus sp. HWE-109 TaxID=1306526 RepID=UPI001EDE345E|nr:cupin domain-containing protein [Paenibacillus sp. HWE-109]UKS28042.1 cupin domain-containing protein [Paenibacillus sp. HWE-109]
MEQYNEWQTVNEWIRRKIFPPGEQMMSMLIHFKQGGSGPAHQHIHEQLGFVISGKIRMEINGQSAEYGAGQLVHVPSNAVHSVVALEETQLLETFTPLRADLLLKE